MLPIGDTVDSENPYIYATDRVVHVGDTVDEAFLRGNGRYAYDREDGNFTTGVTLNKTTIDTSSPKIDTVTYSVKDSDNNITNRVVNIVVLPLGDEVETEAPYIYATDRVVHVGDTVDEAFLRGGGMYAYDKKDGNLTTSVIFNPTSVDTSTPKIVKVTYSVTDSDNNTTTKTVNIVVLPVGDELDSENPYLYATDRIVYIGDTIDYPFIID